eukprot:gene18892-24688_t
MLRIVLSLLSRPESLAFRDPVDWKGMGLLDYPEIIKKPMDLGTVRKRIETNYYEDVDGIANDIRLIWTNCMLYNRDGSEYYHLADSFSRAFEDAYAALRKLEDSKSDSNRVPSVDERIQLSYDIFKLDNKEMAHVLTILQQNCPSALSHKASVDEVLINIDAFPPNIFHEINNFTQGCILNSSLDGKGKKRSNDSSNSIEKSSKKK